MPNPVSPVLPASLHLRPARRFTVRTAAALALAAGASAIAWAQAPGGGGAPPPMPVTVLEIVPGKVPTILDAVGRTEGPRDVEVRARVTGILERKLFQEGDVVKAGAPLYRIDRAPFEIALAQARAAQVQEKVKLERAQLEAKRLKQLVDERAISQREYDDAAANLRQFEATLAAADARVREAQLNLSYTSVTAQIGGITGRTLRSEGSLVTAGSDSALLTTITQTDPIWVRFSLSEAEFARLRNSGDKSGRVSLVTADGKPYDRPGKLNFTSSQVDAKLGTVQLRAEFPNPSMALLPGQFVKALVSAGQQDGVLVPQSAVFQGDQGPFVWVVGADNKIGPRPVQTGNWVGKDWVVRGGLKEGDKVAIDNLIKLRPGMTVAPQARGAGGAPAGAPAAAGGGAAPQAAGSPPAAAGAPAAAAPQAGGAAPAAAPAKPGAAEPPKAASK